MAAIPPFIAIPGINITFWSTIGLLRFVQEKFLKPNRLTRSEKKLVSWMKKNVVAVAIAARNEQVGIGRTIRSLKNQVGKKNIYVASDGSTDKTAQIARRCRVNVVALYPNRGKAGALAYLIDHFNLLNNYLFILFVDADTHIDRRYLKLALPYFADPAVVAVAGHGKTAWRKHFLPNLSMFFVAYRDRLYNLLQFTFRFGQTAKWANVSPIVPGFASIYRTSALKKIEINTPNLVIEDFNMTFQIHHRRLGKIAYHPKIFGIARDPTHFSDYLSQVKRWNLGFWQTLIRHGLWPSFFSLALMAFVAESLLAAVFFALLPIIILLLLSSLWSTLLPPWLNAAVAVLAIYLSLTDILLIFLADYLLTIVVAAATRRPHHLIYGLGFPLLRIVDAFLIILAFPQALITKSRGSWIPAKRR